MMKVGRPRKSNLAATKKQFRLSHNEHQAISRLGGGSPTVGAQKLAKVVSELEILTDSLDKSLDELIELIPFCLKIALRDWQRISTDQKVVGYLIKKASIGDPEAIELYESCLLNTAEIETQELIDQKVIKIKDSYIV